MIYTRPSMLLYLYLKAHTGTGGIEQVTRNVLHALDAPALSPYEGPGKGAFRFLFTLLRQRTQSVLAAHINLAPAVFLLALLHPRLRIVLQAHGIEVWQPLRGWKRWLLRRADRILAVSEYTRRQIMERHGIPGDKIVVLPNSLPPGYRPEARFDKPAYLLQRYGLQPDQPVLLTVCRLHAAERYKGYDRVLEALPRLLPRFPTIQYLMGGRADAEEQARIEALIDQLGLRAHARLCGFIPDAELPDYYRLADLFAMPSTGEGFGLAFIEAMAHGTPALGGNQDGSPQALDELGYTTDPTNPIAIADAITQALLHPPDPVQLQAQTLEKFGFQHFLAALCPLWLK